MSPTNHPERSALASAHQARHRVMARRPRPDVDCLEEQAQAAEAMGDEYLTALLRTATSRLASQLMDR